MPLSDNELRDVQARVLNMIMETISTLRLINENSKVLFGDNSAQVSNAINEYLRDFIDNPSQANQLHPEALIYQTKKEKFQDAGLYGSQLILKERQVTEANKEVQASLVIKTLNAFRSPFKKWVDRINNFLSSVIPTTGFGEALKELKDCLRGELPEDNK
jgi:hypothetical protein